MGKQLTVSAPTYKRKPRKKKHQKHSILVYGYEGTGKTYFALSVLDWLTLVQGLKVEDLCVRIIDTDHGVEPILDHFNEDYFDCIEIAYPKDMDEIEDVCNYFIKECTEWQDKKIKELGPRGIYSSWLICDTIAGWWDGSTGAQEWYSKAKRNMSLTEIRMDDDERLDPRDDYKTINPKHNYLADRLKASGINFIWTAPAKDVFGTGKDKYKKLDKHPAGQKLNRFRVNDVIYLHADPEAPINVWAFLEKSRSVTHCYGGTPDMKRQAKKEDKERMITINRVTYIKHMNGLDACKEIDKVKREEENRFLIKTLKAKGVYKKGMVEGDEEEEKTEENGWEEVEDNDNDKPKSIVKPTPKTTVSDEEVEEFGEMDLDL